MHACSAPVIADPETIEPLIACCTQATLPEFKLAVECPAEDEEEEAADLQAELDEMDRIMEGNDLLPDEEDIPTAPVDEKWEAFQTFAEENPDHIIRYSQKGQCLWLFEGAEPKIAHCKFCDKARFFEFQLQPGLFSITGSEDVLDFGTVAVYACDCETRDYVEEQVIVQKEPESWWTTSRA